MSWEPETFSMNGFLVENTRYQRNMKFEIYKDAAGEWRWRLKARNGEIVGVSGEGLKNRKDAVAIVVEIKEACLQNRVSIEVEKK
jgi:uncharacterized protein